MTTLTIRNIEPSIKERLRDRAVRNGRTLAAELRAIVTEAVDTPAEQHGLGLYDRIRARVEPLGGVDLQLPVRAPLRGPPLFE